MALARACSVVALLSLAGGSALLAAASILGDDIEERVWPVMFLWLPTFILTWAFGVAAFAAKGRLNTSAAVIAFFVGFMAGWYMLATTMASSVIGVFVLVSMNAAAIYFVRRGFWTAAGRPAQP
jgi:hypothetical protein